jgi:hypothetical protein
MAPMHESARGDDGGQRRRCLLLLLQGGAVNLRKDCVFYPLTQALHT